MVTVQGAKHGKQHDKNHDDNIDPQSPEHRLDDRRKPSPSEPCSLLGRYKLVRFEDGERGFGMFEYDLFTLGSRVIFIGCTPRGLGLDLFQ
jgi:hypothetical protein